MRISTGPMYTTSSNYLKEEINSIRLIIATPQAQFKKKSHICFIFLDPQESGLERATPFEPAHRDLPARLP